MLSAKTLTKYSVRLQFERNSIGFGSGLDNSLLLVREISPITESTDAQTYKWLFQLSTAGKFIFLNQVSPPYDWKIGFIPLIKKFTYIEVGGASWEDTENLDIILAWIS